MTTVNRANIFSIIEEVLNQIKQNVEWRILLKNGHGALYLTPRMYDTYRSAVSAINPNFKELYYNCIPVYIDLSNPELEHKTIIEYGYRNEVNGIKNIYHIAHI